MGKITYASQVDSKVQGYVTQELERFANLVGDIIVTSGFRAGDSGEHGRGLAVDIVPATNNHITLLDLYLTAERGNWKGIGVYPNWDNDGKGTKSGGLHLDLRAGPPARWLGTGSGKSQQYLALNQENLKTYGVI